MKFMLIEKDKVAILVPNMPIKTYLYKDKKTYRNRRRFSFRKRSFSLIYVLDDMYKK